MFLLLGALLPSFSLQNYKIFPNPTNPNLFEAVMPFSIILRVSP